MAAETVTGPLTGRRILIGDTGGIAAYKAADLVGCLVQHGTPVDVAMTPAATSFVTVATFAAFTQRRVHDDVRERWSPGSTGHISLARRAEVYVPATATASASASADGIAKLAAGMADDVVGAAALSSTWPLPIAPPMEHHMWRHPATIANVQTLRDRGATFVAPDSGHLASGAVGDGRLASRDVLVGAIRVALGRNGPLARQRVLASAGGTGEPLDPVRFLGNGSSGRMGRALAEAAIDLGARVDLVSTVASHVDLSSADVTPVDTADEMADAIRSRIVGLSAPIMCAAVADHRPARPSEPELKRAESSAAFDLAVVENQDILKSVASAGAPRVGFAAETDDLIVNGRIKLLAKRLDVVVVNEARATIASCDVRQTLLFADGTTETLPRLAREAGAAVLCGRILELLAGRR